MRDERPESWPFFRAEPDKIVLAPLPGVTPSEAPPVRIFLGTEESQYRAERIFFYSILQVRDPARTYEVYLMKNLEGFDRSSWRTGFTNYRYAIPTLAGGTGKAIYNDVDQIYLADPALMFDLPMDGRGYLAIADSDTSVMLIDCARMLPMWNREAASRGSKKTLLNKPRSVPGLWGQLDPHWNARDQEYDERLTKCLHYTALHQQPWEPFPEVYSYHANPLAYIWHDLEAKADAEGYQLFTAEEPSPGYASRLGRNERVAGTPRRAGVPSAKAAELARRLDARSLENVTAMPGGMALAAAAFGTAQSAHLDLRSGARNWPAAKADMVAVSDLFELVPPADVPWILDLLFARAGKLLYVAVGAKPGRGLGSAVWWRRRLDEAAQFHPGKSWHLDAVRTDDSVTSVSVERATQPALRHAWVLTTGEAAEEEQAIALAQALGMPFETKPIALGGMANLPGRVRGQSRLGLDQAHSAALEAPWPDLVIAGRQAAPLARWIKRQAGGRPHLVQLGRPAGSFAGFDLIVAPPEAQLPIRDNVIQVAAPLASPAKSRANGKVDHLADATQPEVVALFITGGRFPYVMQEENALEIARVARQEASQSVRFIVCATTMAALPLAQRVATVLDKEVETVGPSPTASSDTALAAARAVADVLERADAFIMTGDDLDLVARAGTTGKPLALVELPLWYDKYKVVRPALGMLKKLSGGGMTYRGTPHQQHMVGRFLDRMTVGGWRRPGVEGRALQRALVARGLATTLGRPPVSSVRPLDDLDRVVRRIRRLMSERRL